MAQTFYDNDGGGGTQLYSTTGSWSTGSVPTGGNPAILTDDRTATSMLGETVTTAFADEMIITNYSGDIGTSGTHLIFDSAGGNDLMTLQIARASGTIYIDVNTNDTLLDLRINSTGITNIAGSGAFTAAYLVRGNINLGMSGVLANLYIAHSTTPQDVICDINSSPDLTNVRQGGGTVTNAVTNAIAEWTQDGGMHWYTGSGTITDYFLHGGHFRFDGATSSTTITNLFVYGGVCDMSKSGALRTITNTVIWPGAIVDIRHVEDLVTFSNNPVVLGNGQLLGQQNVTAIK